MKSRKLLTGNDVKTLRERLKWSQAEFAEVLGVGTSTVRRWEAHKHQLVAIDTGSLRILLRMHKLLEQAADEEVSDVSTGVLSALMVGGGLVAMAFLLNSLIDDGGSNG